MGDIVPFRGKRRWTRPEDYGHRPERPRKKPSGPGGGRGWRGLFTGLRFWALLVTLITLWVLYDPMLYEPPAFLSTEPEKVSGDFTRCGRGRGEFCVVDGDTFKLGDRTVRIVGMDAPELHSPRCPEEPRRAEAAAAALQDLLNRGPFTIAGRIDNPTDRYGRELRVATRRRPDGSTQSIAADMRSSGHARPYLGGMRATWCARTP
jgi:micrococcal nuclease